MQLNETRCPFLHSTPAWVGESSVGGWATAGARAGTPTLLRNSLAKAERKVDSMFCSPRTYPRARQRERLPTGSPARSRRCRARGRRSPRRTHVVPASGCRSAPHSASTLGVSMLHAREWHRGIVRRGGKTGRGRDLQVLHPAGTIGRRYTFRIAVSLRCEHAGRALPGGFAVHSLCMPLRTGTTPTHDETGSAGQSPRGAGRR